MIVVFLVLLGLCFGSFVSAMVWRIRQQQTRKLTAKQKRALSMLHGRSMCPHCRHVLSWKDLLPVVSWLSLGGKCRYCGRKIDDNPLVEVVTAALFVGSYLAWPYGFAAEGMMLFAAWLIFLVGFVALAVYDLRWMELPNRIVYPLIGLAVVQTLWRVCWATDRLDVLVGALLGFLAIGGVFYGLFQVSGGRWIGGGDVKLGFVIGILVGSPSSSILVIFLSSVLGTLASLPFLARRSLKATSRIPFGPFLLVATVLVYLYGDSIGAWYLARFVGM